jgi:hypothetical protein
MFSELQFRIEIDIFGKFSGTVISCILILGSAGAGFRTGMTGKMDGTQIL